MPVIKPFRGIIYNKEKPVRIKDVVAPPYDVISSNMRDELYRASPYSIIRIILGKELPGDTASRNKYTRAREFLSKWLNKGILVYDKAPALYVYIQDYKEDGRGKKRVGFISLMHLEAFSKHGVRPHENTFSKPKADRFRLIARTHSNLSPIFSLYNDGKGTVRRLLTAQCRRVRPFIDIYSEGMRHRIYQVTDADAIRRVEAVMRKKPVFIADGHHRYEVALKFQREMRRLHHGAAGIYDYVMMYFCDMNPRGMTILATHRIIKDIGSLKPADITKRLKGYFTIKKCKGAKDLLRRLKGSKGLSHHFGLYFSKEAYLIRMKKNVKGLDVSILHDLILKRILNISDAEGNVVYTRDPKEAIRAVASGRFKIAFLLNPTKVSEVESIASARGRMPHKSTYFYPKLLSGLVINKLC